MNKELWSKNNPLFMYGNEEKLDDLLGRAFGDIMTGFEKAHQSTIGGQIEVAAKFGSILKLLGIGDLDSKASGKLDATNIKKVISKISFDQKLGALSEYASTLDFFPYLNIFEGLALERRSGALVQDWPATEIGIEHQTDSLGQMLGIFEAVRMSPPHDETANIATEYFESKNTFWLLKSVADSKFYAELPIFLKHTRSNSQHGLMAFLKSNGRFKIECLGLLTWQDGTITSDPVAWRLFY